MKDKEAMELGFYYTGISNAAYDRDGWEKSKKRAQEIKATYKGADFRVVDHYCEGRYGKSLWKNIYGNEVFRKAQYFDQTADEKYFSEIHQQRLDKIKQKYEEELAKEQEYYEKKKINYDYLVSLKKKK